MSITFGIDRWPDGLLDVPNPGHGEIDVCLPHDGGTAVDMTLRGLAIGAALEQVAAIATRQLLDSPFGTVDALRTSLSIGEARLLLPTLMRAAIIATAGSNVFDATYADDATTVPEWCVTCGEGAIYATQECARNDGPTASCARTDWCALHGHTWYAGRAPAPAATVPAVV